MPGCRRGVVRNGFTRKDRLVTHLINKNSDGKHSSGHGVLHFEAQKIAIDLDKQQRDRATPNTGSTGGASAEERGSTAAGECQCSFTELLEADNINGDVD